MRGMRVVTALLAAGSLVLAGSAFAATETSQAPAAAKTASTAVEATKAPASHMEREAHHIVRGEVTEVDATTRTLAVRTARHKKELTVEMQVPEKTVIREGKTSKTLADIQVGNQVWVKYDRTSKENSADTIHILKSKPKA